MFLVLTSIIFLYVFNLGQLTSGQIRFLRISNGSAVFIREGTNNSLSCRVTGTARDYQWSKAIKENKSMVPFLNSNSSVFNFTLVKKADEGEYVCQAKAVNGSRWENSTVTKVIIVPKGHVLHVDILNGTRLSIRLHSSARLLCKAEGENLTYQWSKTTLFGGLLPIKGANESFLTFANFTNAGTYVCQVRSANQTYWVNSTKISISSTPDRTSHVKIVNGPMITIIEGSNGWLKCEADGYGVEFKWAKIDFWGRVFSIPEAKRYDYFNLLKARPLDEDRYICQARSFGQTNWVNSKPTYVKIKPLISLVEIVNGTKLYVKKGSKTTFLLCKSRVNSSEYRWKKSDSHGEMKIIKHSNEKVLHFKKFKPKNAGKFVCQVKYFEPLNRRTIWLSSNVIKVKVSANSCLHQHSLIIISTAILGLILAQKLFF